MATNPISNPLDPTNTLGLPDNRDDRMRHPTPQAGAAGELAQFPKPDKQSEMLRRQMFDLLEGHGSFDERLESIGKDANLRSRQLDVITQSLDARAQRKVFRRTDKILGGKGRARELIDLEIEKAKANIQSDTLEQRRDLLGEQAIFTSKLAEEWVRLETIDARKEAFTIADEAIASGLLPGVGSIDPVKRHHIIENGGDPSSAYLPPASSVQMSRMDALYDTWFENGKNTGEEASTTLLEELIRMGYVEPDQMGIIQAALQAGAGVFDQASRQKEASILATERGGSKNPQGTREIITNAGFGFTYKPGETVHYTHRVHTKYRQIVMDIFQSEASLSPRAKQFIQGIGLFGSEAEWRTPTMIADIVPPPGADEDTKEAARLAMQAFITANQRALEALGGAETGPFLLSLVNSHYSQVWKDMDKSPQALARILDGAELFGLHDIAREASIAEEMERRRAAATAATDGPGAEANAPE